MRLEIDYPLAEEIEKERDEKKAHADGTDDFCRGEDHGADSRRALVALSTKRTTTQYPLTESGRMTLLSS